jgi:hypothetical protein
MSGFIMTRTFVGLALTAWILAPGTPAALAHEGHDHKFMGVVSALHESHLEVKDVKGKATSLVLEAQTRVRRGRSILRVADIKVGDRVVVTARQVKGKDGKAVYMVREVQLGATPVAAKK